MTDTQLILREIIKAIEDTKATDLKIIEITGISSIADYFVLVSGDNVRQVRSIARNIEEKLGKEGVNPLQTEGYQNANWILMDYSDIIVHVFDKESRNYYNLDRIWKDGKILDPQNLK